MRSALILGLALLVSGLGCSHECPSGTGVGGPSGDGVPYNVGDRVVDGGSRGITLSELSERCSAVNSPEVFIILEIKGSWVKVKLGGPVPVWGEPTSAPREIVPYWTRFHVEPQGGGPRATVWYVCPPQEE